MEPGERDSIRFWRNKLKFLKKRIVSFEQFLYIYGNLMFPAGMSKKPDKLRRKRKQNSNRILKTHYGTERNYHQGYQEVERRF